MGPVRLTRLLAMTFSLSLRRQLAFRADLFFEGLLTLFSISAGLSAIGVVFTRTESLGGWGPWQVIVLYGTFQVTTGLLQTFVEPGLQAFPSQVRAGAVDPILLRPVPSVLLASLGRSAPLSLLESTAGLGVVGWGLAHVGPPSPVRIAEWLMLLALAMIIAWALRTLAAAVTLFVPSAKLGSMFVSGLQFGRYPVSIYHQPARALLTYVVPVAMLSTIPSLALLRGIDAGLMGVAVAGAAIAVLATTLIWRAGLRRYTGATG